MILDNRTKKILKVLGLVAVIFVLTGCTANLEDGKLIAERAINESTPWNLDVGIFDFIFVFPIAKGILFATKYLGNVALGVIVITIVINLITLPIMIKSTISTQKMQLLQPEIERIQKKYQGRKDQTSQMRMNNEVQNLYKKNNVSMFGSFTTFLTLPIMFAMWQAVQRIEILYTGTFLGFKLGDSLMSLVEKIDIPAIILLLLVGATQFLGMEITNIMAKRNPKFKQTAQMKSMRKMNYFMILMIIWFALSQPSAMSFYWITTNLVSVARTIYIQLFHIEKARKEVEDKNTNFLNKKKK
ncbi:MAG: YidC/Oxa1 family membrane protein insertase [Coprobacillaceae bacterium]